MTLFFSFFFLLLFRGGHEISINDSGKGIDNIKKWFDINKLSLNEDKTTFLVFGTYREN